MRVSLGLAGSFRLVTVKRGVIFMARNPKKEKEQYSSPVRNLEDGARAKTPNSKNVYGSASFGSTKVEEK